jgi:hypothetical protein
VERPRYLEAAGDAESAPPVGGHAGDVPAIQQDLSRLVRSRPEMQLMSVVLPDPLGPIRPKRSPGAIAMLTSESAVKPPKCFETLAYLERAFSHRLNETGGCRRAASTTKSTSSSRPPSTFISPEDGHR